MQRKCFIVAKPSTVCIYESFTRFEEIWGESQEASQVFLQRQTDRRHTSARYSMGQQQQQERISEHKGAIAMPPIQIIGPARRPQRDEKDAEQRSHHHQPASMRNAAGNMGNNSSNRASDSTLNHVCFSGSLFQPSIQADVCFSFRYYKLLAFTLPPRAHPVPRTSRRSGRNAPTWGRSTRERE